MTTIGVFASIFNEAGDVLCVQRNYAPFGWTTPGGRLEDGESPEVAVIREVLEETGYHVTVERLIGLYAAPFKSDLVISFACRITGQVHWQANEEIAAMAFFPSGALPSPMKSNTRSRIQDALEGKEGIWRTFTAAEHA
jgi:ADP-ribose pyrophosphatase YjhB (NUDIX family)